MEFRFKALQQQHDPDDLDASVNLANPKSWIAVFVTLLLILGAIGWSLLGRLPQTAGGNGIITRVDGVVRIEAGYQAVVAADPPAAGDRVEAGMPLITVTDPDGAVHHLSSPVGGTVMTADYRPGVWCRPARHWSRWSRTRRPVRRCRRWCWSPPPRPPRCVPACPST